MSDCYFIAIAEPIAIGFNPKYVVELLTQMSSDQITIALGGELDPALIRPLIGDDRDHGRDHRQALR